MKLIRVCGKEMMNLQVRLFLTCKKQKEKDKKDQMMKKIQTPRLVVIGMKLIKTAQLMIKSQLLVQYCSKPINYRIFNAFFFK